MSRAASYESKIQTFLIADEEHLGMAGFGKAVWNKFGEFHHRRQWRFNINLWNRPMAAACRYI
jgi:hypothetical protein